MFCQCLFPGGDLSSADQSYTGCITTGPENCFWLALLHAHTASHSFWLWFVGKWWEHFNYSILTHERALVGRMAHFVPWGTFSELASHDATAAPPKTHIGGTITASGAFREAAAEELQHLIYPGPEGMLSGWLKENGCGQKEFHLQLSFSTSA